MNDLLKVPAAFLSFTAPAPYFNSTLSILKEQCPTVCPGTFEDVLQELALINVAFPSGGIAMDYTSPPPSSLRPTAKGATASYLKHTHRYKSVA